MVCWAALKGQMVCWAAFKGENLFVFFWIYVYSLTWYRLGAGGLWSLQAVFDVVINLA